MLKVSLSSLNEHESHGFTQITMVSSFKIHVSSLAEMKENAKAIIPEPAF